MWSSWWRRRNASQHVEEMREKEWAGPGILAYVHQVDTSVDEHKRAGLRGADEHKKLHTSV
jgi:hypothetical protein